MILVRDFRSWKSTYIIGALVVMSLFFAIFMPKTQALLNKELVKAVFENNVTKVKIAIDEGANIDLLLPKGQPLISVAIESGNIEILELLYVNANSLRKYFNGYIPLEHAIAKNRKDVLIYLLGKIEGTK